MIVAVVLSAGESSRMGRPKALLPVEGVPFVERIVTALRASRVRDILLVLGHDAARMRREVERLPVTVLVNDEYRKGQLSSLLCAIRSLQGTKGVDGILVHLVDHPFVNPALVDLMIERFYESKKLIVIPRHGGRRGHPVLFSSALFPELSSAPPDRGAKAVVHAHAGDVLEIDTDDKGVLLDIDTPEDYREHVGGE